MSQVIPQYGVTGLFLLKAPFDALLVADVAYTCKALQTISSLEASGVDVQAEYYTAFELSEEAYKADAFNDVTMVTLEAPGVGTATVPASYILGQPQIGGVPYTGMMLTIRLGPLPNSQDLVVVKQKVADDVLELLGVQATVKEVVISPTTLLTVDQAKLVEAARQGKIGTVITDYTRYRQAQTQLEAAQQQIAQLEEYIRINMPPAP